MKNKMRIFLSILFISITSNAFACQYDYECAVGQYCKNGTISFETQEGICVKKPESVDNPGSVFYDMKKDY